MPDTKPDTIEPPFVLPAKELDMTVETARIAAEHGDVYEREIAWLQLESAFYAAVRRYLRARGLNVVVKETPAVVLRWFLDAISLSNFYSERAEYDTARRERVRLMRENDQLQTENTVLKSQLKTLQETMQRDRIEYQSHAAIFHDTTGLNR